MLDKYNVILIFAWPNEPDATAYEYEVWATSASSAKDEARKIAKREGHFGLRNGVPTFKAKRAKS